MKNAKLEMKRKGFTLVELLIVIVVIGVLSAMMMLSSTEAVSSAKAADIVSDLRNLKTAALSYYADNLDTAETVDVTTDTVKIAIIKYLGETDKDTSKVKNYKFAKGNPTTTEWYVYYDGVDTNVRPKLASRAASTGLLKDAKQSTTSSGKTTANTYDGGEDVYMFIR